VMDGYQFYEHWRAMPELKSIPLFIVTAGRAARDALPEATHLLPKPLDLDRLLELLASSTK
jgi:CheY-like chemotaxis protein